MVYFAHKDHSLVDTADISSVSLIVIKRIYIIKLSILST